MGSGRVSPETLAAGGGAIGIDVRQEGDQVKVSVSGDGIGIPACQPERHVGRRSFGAIGRELKALSAQVGA